MQVERERGLDERGRKSGLVAFFSGAGARPGWRARPTLAAGQGAGDMA